MASRVLAGMEDDGEWSQLLASWRDEYKPDSPSYEQHVQRAAQAEFALRLEERRYDAANREWLNTDPADWDDKLHKRERQMFRRLDSAEKQAIRWSGVVERYRRARLVDKSREPLVVPPRPWTGPPAQERPYVQYVIVRVADGVTKTIYNPPNDAIQRLLTVFDRPDAKVRRILQFRDQVPAEYEWAKEPDGANPGSIERVLSREEYIAECEREEQAGTGHLVKK